jgi:hypothetical protein
MRRCPDGRTGSARAIGRRASSSLHAVKRSCDVVVAAGDVMVVVCDVTITGVAVCRLIETS